MNQIDYLTKNKGDSQLSTSAFQCHSPGHRGKWGNEQADQLANNGADLPYIGGENDDENLGDEDADFTDEDV